MFSGSIPCANFWPYHIDRTSRSSVETFCVVIAVRVGKKEEGRNGTRKVIRKGGRKREEGKKGRRE